MESAPTAAGVGVLDELECWRLLQGSCNLYIENAAVTGTRYCGVVVYLFKASLVTFFSKKVTYASGR